MTPLVLCATLLAAQAADAGRPPASPPRFDRLLTAADVDGLSLEDLALMRNTIYARAGRTFKNPKLRDYFAKQPWYRPAAAPAKLTAVDAANVRTISARERALLSKPIVTACPAPWTDGEVHDAALAKKLAGLAGKVEWSEGYGAPSACKRKVRLNCGPDLDGDGLPEAIVAINWRVLLNGSTCKTSGDDSTYWNVTYLLLISGNPQKQSAVAALGSQSDEFPGTSASASFVRLRDGRAGVESSNSTEASDTGCESGETNVYAMEHGKLRKVETRSQASPCDAQ
jgi:hypothetical protein